MNLLKSSEVQSKANTQNILIWNLWMWRVWFPNLVGVATLKLGGTELCQSHMEFP